MLNSDKLILVELHKAGSARVKKVLGDVVGGEMSAKQSLYSDGLAALGKPVVGYVGNPLIWYLDQWQNGCTGKGETYKRLTDQAKWDTLNAKRSARTPKDGQKEDPKTIPEGWNAEHAKSFWYAEDARPEAFREWLKAVAEHRGTRRLVDHGWANSPANRVAGLMTHQFFLLFVRNAENMERSVNTMDALKALHAKQAITSRFVRAEEVAGDLRKTLSALGVALNDEQGAAIDALKSRAGADEAAILKYYDPASLRLVAKREAFINDLFGYGPPSAEARAAAKAAKAEKKAGKGDGEGKGEAKEGKAKKADQPEKAAKASREEKEQKRAARAERQAARAAKSADNVAKPNAEQAPNAKAAKPQAEKPAKPQKVKRVKNRPADEDVVDADE